MEVEDVPARELLSRLNMLAADDTDAVSAFELLLGATGVLELQRQPLEARAKAGGEHALACEGGGEADRPGQRAERARRTTWLDLFFVGVNKILSISFQECSLPDYTYSCL